MRDSLRRVTVGATINLVSLAALASAPLVSGASTVSCNIPQACALYANANGPGLAGTSAKNEGIVGTTTFAGTSTSNRTYGVEGVDGSTNKSAYNVGVYGTSPYGLGLYGISPSGTGVYGTTTSGYGVRATASSGTAVSGTSSSGNGVLGQTSATNTSTKHAGLTGVDASSTSGVVNDGVLGTTKNGGYGVEGTSGDNAGGGVRGLATTGLGVTGMSTSGIGTYGYGPGFVGVYGSGSTAGTGVYGSGYNGTGTQGYSYASYGLYGSTNSGIGLGVSAQTGYGIDVATGNGGSSTGLRINTTDGNATDITGNYIGVLGRSDSYPLVLTNTAGNDLFYVDGSGNIYAHGTYRTFVATRDGSASTAFTARSTTPNVEDTGTSRLVNGVATVRFDPAFAASIDAHAVYQVFLTPGGDTRGLFVATKTPAGFEVRETQGGRGTLAFDYRIVAAAPGHARERMALVSTSSVAPKATPSTHQMRPLPTLADPNVKRSANR